MRMQVRSWLMGGLLLLSSGGGVWLSAAESPEAGKLLVIGIRVFPEPDRHVADPFAAAGIKLSISHVCDSSCHSSWL